MVLKNAEEKLVEPLEAFSSLFLLSCKKCLHKLVIHF